MHFLQLEKSKQSKAPHFKCTLYFITVICLCVTIFSEVIIDAVNYLLSGCETLWFGGMQTSLCCNIFVLNWTEISQCSLHFGAISLFRWVRC